MSLFALWADMHMLCIDKYADTDIVSLSAGLTERGFPFCFTPRLMLFSFRTVFNPSVDGQPAYDTLDTYRSRMVACANEIATTDMLNASECYIATAFALAKHLLALSPVHGTHVLLFEWVDAEGNSIIISNLFEECVLSYLFLAQCYVNLNMYAEAIRASRQMLFVYNKYIPGVLCVSGSMIRGLFPLLVLQFFVCVVENRVRDEQPDFAVRANYLARVLFMVVAEQTGDENDVPRFFVMGVPTGEEARHETIDIATGGGFSRLEALQPVPDGVEVQEYSFDTCIPDELLHLYPIVYLMVAYRCLAFLSKCESVFDFIIDDAGSGSDEEESEGGSSEDFSAPSGLMFGDGFFDADEKSFDMDAIYSRGTNHFIVVCKTLKEMNHKRFRAWWRQMEECEHGDHPLLSHGLMTSFAAAVEHQDMQFAKLFDTMDVPVTECLLATSDQTSFIPIRPIRELVHLNTEYICAMEKRWPKMRKEHLVKAVSSADVVQLATGCGTLNININ